MIYRASHNQLSTEFLHQHHDLVLQDIFHHIQAYLLFPSSSDSDELRQKAILSMSMGFYHKAMQDHANSNRLDALRKIFDLPEDSFFKTHYEECYPLWLAREELNKREKEKHFKIVNRLCWTMLRSSKSYQAAECQPQASIKEAVDLIMGQMPLKAKRTSTGMEYLCSEKFYGKMLKRYMPLCHFIMAHEHMRGDYAGGWYGDAAFLFTPDQIERFLNLSLWFRTNLQKLVRTNVKDPVLFPDTHLLSLPDWVSSKDIDIPILPFEEKIQEIKSKIVIITSEEMRLRRERHEQRQQEKRALAQQKMARK